MKRIRTRSRWPLLALAGVALFLFYTAHSPLSTAAALNQAATLATRAVHGLGVLLTTLT